MANVRIEIREVEAHQVDTGGRVRGLRVLGVADRRDKAILVTLNPAGGDDKTVLLANFHLNAKAYARIVRPASVGWLEANARFGGDLRLPERAGTPAHFWCAEFDLGVLPQVPPITLGVQTLPWSVQAEDLHAPGDRSPVRYTVASLHLVPAFAVGVLFVHGIGLQTKSDTLSGWSAPLLGWINDWFAAARNRLAARAEPNDVAGWLSTLLVRTHWGAHDQDSGDRYLLAEKFADQVDARRHTDRRGALAASAGRAWSNALPRQLTADELAAGARFVAHLRDELGASVVGGMAELADARLLDGATRGADPASVEMRVHTLAPDGEVQRSHWLMAESHWGDSFRAPPFFAFGWWCLRTAPVIWVHYFALTFERCGRSWLRAGWTLLPSATVVLLVALAFAALFVLSLVPWDRLRKGLVSVQRVLAGVVGDSYVFLNDPVQRRSVVDRVRRDVEWLSQRCRKVVVVAHSQGAAVADRALNSWREYKPERLDTLVTLGAGLQTLDRISELQDNRYVRVAGVLGLSAAALFWGAVFVGATSTVTLASAGAAGAGLALLALAGVRAWKSHPGLSSVSHGASGDRDWHDFFASRDLVPWGPLARVEEGKGHYLPHEVANLHSFIGDHTSYWQNAEEVVGPVASVVAKAAGLPAIERAVPNVRELMGHAARARHHRVQWLRVARAAAVLCTLALLWTQWPSIASVAGWAWQAALSKLGVGDGTTSFPGWSAVGRVIAVLVPWLLFSTVLRGLWTGWGQGERARIYLSQTHAVATGHRAGFVVAIAALVALTFWLGYPAWWR